MFYVAAEKMLKLTNSKLRKYHLNKKVQDRSLKLSVVKKIFKHKKDTYHVFINNLHVYFAF